MTPLQLHFDPEPRRLIDYLTECQAAYKLQSKARLNQLQREGITMGLLNPDVAGSDGNLTDVYPEGEPFTITDAEVVKATTDYGEGEMVVFTVEDAASGGTKRLSIWGAYLVAQVKDATASDYPATVRIERGPVEGFSNRKDTKRLVAA